MLHAEVSMRPVSDDRVHFRRAAPNSIEYGSFRVIHPSLFDIGKTLRGPEATTTDG
jgi:hypothetical protein